MENPIEVQATSRYVVTITTDEYADLLAARTRLDVICGLLSSKENLDKETLLTVLLGAPLFKVNSEAGRDSDV